MEGGAAGLGLSCCARGLEVVKGCFKDTALLPAAAAGVLGKPRYELRSRAVGRGRAVRAPHLQGRPARLSLLGFPSSCPSSPLPLTFLLCEELTHEAEGGRAGPWFSRLPWAFPPRGLRGAGCLELGGPFGPFLGVHPADEKTKAPRG